MLLGGQEFPLGVHRHRYQGGEQQGGKNRRRHLHSIGQITVLDVPGQHHGEDYQDGDGPNVDQYLDHGQELGAEQNEEPGHCDEDHDQEQRGPEQVRHHHHTESSDHGHHTQNPEDYVLEEHLLGFLNGSGRSLTVFYE